MSASDFKLAEASSVTEEELAEASSVADEELPASAVLRLVREARESDVDAAGRPVPGGSSVLLLLLAA